MNSQLLPLLGFLLIILGFLVKFEFQIITSDEDQDEIKNQKEIKG